MDTEAARAAPLPARVLLIAALGLSCLLLASLLVRPAAAASSASSPSSILCLLMTALAVCAWLLFSIRTSLAISAAVLIATGWAWAAAPHSCCGGLLISGGLLMGLAAWRRQRQIRHLHVVLQAADDLQEEQAVAQQAMAQAHEARDALQKKLARYTRLQTIAETLSALTDLDAVARLAVERAFQLIGKSDACLLLLVDADRQGMSLVASQRREGLPSIRSKQGDQFDRHVLRSHVPLLVNDVRRDFRFPLAPSLKRTIHSVIACPLIVGQAPSGILRLDAAEPNSYTQDDLRLLGILTDLIAAAVANAMLFARTQELAITDGLTGLMLRRPFLEQMARELTRATRMRQPLSLLMLDLDHFKTYNDTLGHTTGDLILKQLAQLLQRGMGGEALVGRYGGEEFVMLLPEHDAARAGQAAEAIRARVEQHREWSGRTSLMSSGSPGGGVTVSIGIASAPEDGETEEALIRIADERLYQAKRAGRNRVCSS